MFSLTDEMFINHGTLRACYQHPENSNLVIKIAIGEKKERKLANLKEMKGYHDLMCRHIDLFCISHCYGFVRTNLGDGLVCDCIRDDNESISKTIWDIISSGDEYDIDYILEVAKNFCDMLMSQRVYIFDLNIKNIIFKLKHDGTYLPFLIDLKGRFDNSELFPFSSYIKYLSIKKMERRSRQLVERISLYGAGKPGV